MSPWWWTPRAARLAKHLPAQSAGAVLGDVLEEYADRLARHGRWRAEAWLVAELSSLRRAYRRSALGPLPRRHAWRVRPAELTQALRALARAPWYAMTLAGVIALSLALGATVFAIVDGALFKPLPYRASARLFAVSLGHSALREPLLSGFGISPAELHEWRNDAPGIFLTGWSAGRLQVVGVHDSVRGAEVDAAFFEVIGMRPVAGGFTATDFETATPVRPALITQDFWRVRFGRDPSVIGRTLLDDTGNGIRVAGILPADFVFPRAADRQFVPELLVPVVDTTPRSLGASLRVLARVTPPMSREEASGRLNTAAARWAAAHPAPPSAPDLPERTRILRGPYDQVGLRPIDDELTSGIAPKAWIVFGVAAALMLLAALNFTSLAIVRIRDRWRDLAVRRALGARYADLARLLALENAVIVAAGTLGGIAAWYVLLPITLRLIGGAYMVVIKPPVIDARVLAFSALVAFACVACVTAFAARSAIRTNWTGAMTRGARGPVSIIMFEVAVALVIAVGGSLLAGSLIRVWREDPGFDVTNAAVVTMAAPPGASAADVEQLVTDVSRLPGVLRAGGTANLILDRVLYGSAFDHPTGFVAPPPGSLGIWSVAVTHGYLETAGLYPRDGRVPTNAEFESGAPVVVVSESVARSYWPGRRAIGQSLVTKGRPFTVIGVVPDARYLSLDRDPAGQILLGGRGVIPAVPQQSVDSLHRRRSRAPHAHARGGDAHLPPMPGRESRHAGRQVVGVDSVPHVQRVALCHVRRRRPADRRRRCPGSRGHDDQPAHP